MPLSRSPMRRTYRQTGPSGDVVEVVLERASRDGEPHCEVCGDRVCGERGVMWALHHRKGRSIPGAHLPHNLILVHGAGNVDSCHGGIHRHRGEAQEYGWSISRNSVLNPLNVIILVGAGARWVYLDNVGRYLDEPAS